MKLNPGAAPLSRRVQMPDRGAQATGPNKARRKPTPGTARRPGPIEGQNDATQKHAKELVRIADMMESCSDDSSREGLRHYRELCKEYTAHALALGITKKGG